jgi:biopolymer transport protein ExbB
MWEIVKSGGIFMVPIVISSIALVGIVFERLWTLQRKRVLPQELIKKVSQLAEANQVNIKVIDALEKNSPLGRVLAAALANRDRGRAIMMERVEDTGRHVVHELERFVNSVGTIASIAPLLGLLGTVTGIINAFKAVMLGGMGDPRMLAQGISEALVCTAGGLTVAIPAYIAHRYLRGKVERIVVEMEKVAVNFADSLGASQQSGESDGGIARTA